MICIWIFCRRSPFWHSAAQMPKHMMQGHEQMQTVAVAIICKTPKPGFSKTRLSPPLHPEECAEVSSCFIRDLSTTIQSLTSDGYTKGYAIYTPIGSEAELQRFLPADFTLVPQCEGDFGDRLYNGIIDLLALGHAGAVIVNSDSPTLPRSILQAAVKAVLKGDSVVLSPANDGGYTFIGLSKAYAHLFCDIPWSTDAVYRLTLERAREIGLSVTVLDGWYDVDDAASYAMLEAEIDGMHPPFADPAIPLEQATATRRFIEHRRNSSSVV